MVVGFSGPAYQRPSEVDDGAVERLAREIAAMPLLFAPGEGYAYSNRGWSMAGYLIQKVSGFSIEEFLRKEVFEPLGMTETTLEFWKVPDLATGYAEGRQVRNHVHPASLSREYGASGMIVSTTRDMGKLLVAMLNGGKTVLGTQYLTPELIAEALRAQAEATSELGGPTRYALGWEVDSTFGELTIKKAGSVHSMVSFWAILPERKTAVAFAFNREDYQIVPLVPAVLTILAGGQAPPFPEARPAAFSPPVPVKVPAGTLTRWVGDYDSSSGDFSVFQRGDSLLTNFDGSEILLVPTSDSSFALVDDLVNNGGKTMIFRRQGSAVTVWLGQDSIGIRQSR
jgi:CubicO group peptidase (beta-lactamase class C family)